MNSQVKINKLLLISSLNNHLLQLLPSKYKDSIPIAFLILVAFVSCMSHCCYKSFDEKQEFQKNVRAEVTSVDGSNLEPLGIVYCSKDFSPQKFDQYFIVFTNLLRTVILSLHFAQSFTIEIDWNSHGKLYLHQNHEPLTYDVTN